VRKLGSFCCIIIFICISRVLVAKTCHFWYNCFIAQLKVKFCAVALCRSIELHKHHPLCFVN
jgi:hypothetical protein